jgi:hypothetical protein
LWIRDRVRILESGGTGSDKVPPVASEEVVVPPAQFLVAFDGDDDAYFEN